MSRIVKWAYSVILLLAMCGVLMAGTYQYLDNLSIPYNINLFGCGSASCTSMVLQNSSGTEIFTSANPGSVVLSNSSVTLSGSPVSVGIGDGGAATLGAKADSAVTNGFSTASVVALLKGILNNVVTPISVTGTVTSTPAASPQGVAVVNNPSVTPPTPLQVTLPASPVSVGLSGSPVSVGIAGPTPLNVTVGGIVSPQGVTIAGPSPVSVGISATPLNVTLGTSPATVNLAQVQGSTISSPTTYGVAPAGSVAGVNAFVTNNPTVVLSGSPVSVGLTAGSSPLNVTTPSPLNVTGSFSTTVSSPLGVVPFNGASPQNVTVGTSPVAVTIASSPVNVTGSITANSASPTNVNLDQINGQLIASPSTYGAAPVGSVAGVNAFVTNNVAVTTPTPLQVTLRPHLFRLALLGLPRSM